MKRNLRLMQIRSTTSTSHWPQTSNSYQWSWAQILHLRQAQGVPVGNRILLRGQPHFSLCDQKETQSDSHESLRGQLVAYQALACNQGCGPCARSKIRFFPTLAVGLLDCKVDVVLARLEADFSDQPPSIPAVPKHQVSLQCPTTKYPCSAQTPSC